jgi:hypothetical protein
MLLNPLEFLPADLSAGSSCAGLFLGVPVKRLALALLTTLTIPLLAEDPPATKLDMPFKVEDLKKTLAKGLVLKWKLAQTSVADGRTSTLTTFVKVEVTEAGEKEFTLATTRLTEKDEDAGSWEQSLPWTADATPAPLGGKEYYPGMFSSANTKVSEEKVSTAAGSIDATLYAWSETGGDWTFTLRTWFAKDRPGVIVKMVHESKRGESRWETACELVELK